MFLRHHFVAHFKSRPDRLGSNEYICKYCGIYFSAGKGWNCQVMCLWDSCGMHFAFLQTERALGPGLWWRQDTAMTCKGPRGVTTGAIIMMKSNWQISGSAKPSLAFSLREAGELALFLWIFKLFINIKNKFNRQKALLSVQLREYKVWSMGCPSSWTIPSSRR